MAIKKKSPLYEITDPTDPDYVDTDDTETTDMFESDLFADEVFGADITKFGSGVQQVDTTSIDQRISQIETPTGGSVWEKQAAYYRQKGEGDVLRMQKDVASLFLPTIVLWQEREAAASAKFELLKQQIPEFDDTLIFGEGGKPPSPMPVVDEIKNISTSVKADLKELSRLNVNDPRYDELRKKIEKEQGIITQFHEINQKLLEIRNDIGEDGQKLGNNLDGDWSDLMDDNEKAMWRDIYNSNGENIKVIDGKLMWVPEGKTSYEFKDDPKAEHVGEALELALGRDSTLGSLLYNGTNADGEQITFKTGQSDDNVKEIQKRLKELYPDHDFGNKKWGPKTQAAYDKYLSEKDELETKWLDENLTKEQKVEHQIITPGKNIDLALIGDGPKMKNGIAFRTSLANYDALYRGLGGGVSPKGSDHGKVLYKALRLSIEDDFKGMGVEGQASLLFDGTSRIGEEDALAVDVFLNDIMANNEGEFPGYKSMNKEQRIEAWNGIRENGMLETYTLNGKEASLQTHFKDFYMGEIDKKAMSYIPPRKTSGTGGPPSSEKEISKTMVSNTVDAWESGDFSKLVLPYGHVITEEDGEYWLETADAMIKIDVNDPIDLKRVLMKYAGNNKKLLAEIEKIVFSEIKFGMKKYNENYEKIKSYDDDHKPEHNKGIKFIVQVYVGDTGEGSINPQVLKSFYEIGDVYKIHQQGLVYHYIAGGYSLKSDATTRIREARKAGFSNAFIYAIKDGERITVEEATKLLNK